MESNQAGNVQLYIYPVVSRKKYPAAKIKKAVPHSTIRLGNLACQILLTR
jgi:hypothetical protein